MYIITIANHKGGVAKTTTAAALTAGLVKAGYKTLAIETDPQGNLAYTLGIKATACLYNVLKGKLGITDAIYNTPYGDIIPAGAMLATYNGDITKLKQVIQELVTRYQYIIIDTPPNNGTLMLSGLMASNAAIIPACPEPYAVTALPDVIGCINAVKGQGNKDLQIMGILATCYNGRAIIRQQSLEQLRNSARIAGIHMFKTVIREGIVIQEAQALQRSIFDYAPRSKQALDYAAFLNEVISYCKKRA